MRESEDAKEAKEVQSSGRIIDGGRGVRQSTVLKYVNAYQTIKLRIQEYTEYTESVDLTGRRVHGKG